MPARVQSPQLNVNTPVFDGPLELLLALVEREEVDIFKVSLARVTDAYLAEVAACEIPDPQEMSEFLWMAARLLLLKSIRLLPGENPTDEETELLGWEDEVRQRLEEYRAYRRSPASCWSARSRKLSRSLRRRARSRRAGRKSRSTSISWSRLSTASWLAYRRGPWSSTAAPGPCRRSWI